MLFEAVLIALAGAAAALLLTVVVFKSLLAYVPARAYGDAALGVDWRVVVFALLLGAMSGFLFSVAPAWRAMRLDVQALVQGRERAGENRYRLPGVMIGVQVALTLVLVLGAGIATRALLSAVRIPVFAVAVVTVIVAAAAAAYLPARRAASLDPTAIFCAE
jgi:putative ABC transport system permease protein